VCLDVKTGKRVWHYQLIHHDMWDWDIPAAPVLLDVTQNGRRIKAVAQVTKQAYTYVFNRETGEPLWPIVERPTPQGSVPGEWYSPTQPIPTKPEPFDLQGSTVNDLADFTPEIKAEALKVSQRYLLGPIFTPPIVVDAGGKQSVLMLPGAGGGANWQSAAADPETGFFYIPSGTTPYGASVQPGTTIKSEMRYVSGPGQIDNVFGNIPLIKPPYGRITAFDLNTGDKAWMVPNGEVAPAIKNNPKMAGVDTSKFGSPDKAGLLVTKTLLFATNGVNSATIRALDKKTGAEIAKIDLPARATGLPMTYMAGGRQFIVVAIGGPNFPHEFVALALPQARPAGTGARPAAQE
jgi:quinoprotein glucose dehydrogenase